MVAARRVGLRRQEGQGLVEYSLIIALVAVLLVATLATFGSQSNGIYSHILTGLSTAMPWG